MDAAAHAMEDLIRRMTPVAAPPGQQAPVAFPAPFIVVVVANVLFPLTLRDTVPDLVAEVKAHVEAPKQQ